MFVKLIGIIVNDHLYFKLQQVCIELEICNCQYFIFHAFPDKIEVYVSNHVITFFGIEFAFKEKFSKSPVKKNSFTYTSLCQMIYLFLFTLEKKRLYVNHELCAIRTSIILGTLHDSHVVNAQLVIIMALSVKHL